MLSGSASGAACQGALGYLPAVRRKPARQMPSNADCQHLVLVAGNEVEHLVP